MMIINKKFIVSAFGLSQRDLGMLGRGLRLSSGRSRSYEMKEDSITDADIVVVDSNSLEKLPKLRENQGLVIVLDKKAIHMEGIQQPYTVNRPLLAPRVLDVLDRITTEKLGFVPELVVGAIAEDDVNFLHGEEQAIKSRISRTPLLSDKPNALREIVDARKKKVLVVDDSLIIREQMKLILEELGSSVTTCSSGEEALQKVGQDDFDVIFLDVIMPGLSGFDTCKKLKMKENRNTKVIMLTSKGSPVSRVRGRLSGANTYITKPATVDKLARYI